MDWKLPMDTTRNTGLSVKNINKSFGPVEALKEVSLDVQEGEFFTLLGPSGCGKTTLLRIVAICRGRQVNMTCLDMKGCRFYETFEL